MSTRHPFRFRTETAAAKVIHLPDETRGRQRKPANRLEGQRPLKKRLAVLLAVIAVPAIAAPGDFGAIAADAAIDPVLQPVELSADARLPFETPGHGFPGSAFYYLADPPAEALVVLPSSDPLERDIGQRSYGEMIDSGPAASPFHVSFGGSDLARAQKCLTQAIYYEAASESEAGQRAVAQVVLNRVSHPSWPGNVCGVVYQGSQRSTGCQFTFTCDGSLTRRPGQSSWARAGRIAADALAGSVYKPVGHATHYHTHWVNPYWAKTLDHVGTIGAHRFYRSRGSAGDKAAFTMGYAGAEPDVSRLGSIASNTRARSTPVSRPAATPAASEPTAGLVQSSSDAPLVGSLPSDPALSGTGQVKQDYANAGQWKGNAAEVLAAREAARETRHEIER